MKLKRQTQSNIPNCPYCNGERELNGNGGYICYFCGKETQAAPAPAKAQPKELQWVSLRDSNGRASSLCLNCRGLHPGHFVVTGNLEHGATVRCDTQADAVKLADHVTRGAFSELLEALKEILKCNHELGAISRPVADQARAAIAKVEGRTA